ncbi:acyltransferase family protein [Adhaeribacter aquaticus]|uniref:acyltransferase family protein n=1 Tax=Adhaeribacter aquaticus TaxID=299567 RepID=UPI00040B9E3E|nr:acyltransferase [Adhaeribacter aquaticus]
MENKGFTKTKTLTTFEQPQIKKAKVHLAYLDGLRGLAALYVVLHHALLQINGASGQSIVENADGEPTLVKLLAFMFRHGRLAVDLFIVISGFCLMLPVTRFNGKLKTSVSEFYFKRARRILPPYFLAMGLSLFLIITIIGAETGTHWDVSIPVSKMDVLTHILLLQDIFSETSLKINHAFWSISVEWRIYFLFPVIVYFWRKIGGISTSALAVISSILLYFALVPLQAVGLSPITISANYLGLFTLGALAADFAFTEQTNLIRIREKLPLKVLLFLAPVAILGINKYGMATYFHGSVVLIDLIMGLFAASLLIAIASGKVNVLNKFLSWKPVVFVGTFAYSLYLIHAPLLQVFSQYVINPLHTGTLHSALLFIFVATPLVTLGSYLFYLVAERPFMKQS